MPSKVTRAEKTHNYKMLYERSPLGYQSLDKDGNIIIVNPAWCELLGYTLDEVIGKWTSAPSSLHITLGHPCPKVHSARAN